MTVRVVVADDHPMYRYGLTAVLEQADGDRRHRQRRRTATSWCVRWPSTARTSCITDLSMPDLDGVAATTHLLAAQPELAVLVLTMHEDDEHVFAALRAGARGYLVKGAGGEEIVRAVHGRRRRVTPCTAARSPGGSSRSSPAVRSSRPRPEPSRT